VTPPSATARTHKVKSGDTPYSIARRYGVSLQALLAANPGLNARQLRVDQSINLPSR
jgi:LysM repeat protein